MRFEDFLPYLFTMALVTYLVRAVPLVLIKRKIENRFVLSFLYYMPYAVLSVMTVPAVFFVTNSIFSAAAGVLAALVLHESLTWQTVLGGGLIVAGTFVLLL